MSKLKQSVAVQRQIPEHIKQNYPAFVEFVKLYYEFLEQTQSQNLESVRDIDTTLDEFISRFKLELAKNVPIDMSDDKRLLLKNIRQFYLSRGSEDSFKFIFKTLFGQEAELFYPSTQMLRVSDGKWQQEISVFVRITGTTASLFPVSGKYIQIITPRKTIQAFAESVSAYNDLVYEIFIQRDYANEITVGSQINYVDANGTTYTGEILACPSKIKVYKPGRGFRVGQLFSLKTSIGNGCLVKITKVNSDGGIQAVQPIKFGLDYVSTFFSYLSSKSIQAYEYIHPLEIDAGQTDYEEYVASPINGVETFNLNYLIENGVPLILVEVTRNNSAVSVTYTATNNTSVTISGLQAGDIVKLYGITTKGIAPAPNVPGYQDQYSDFIEFGFASKQTYMDYDTTIPVQLESHASDRYFVDGSYVGDIAQQFYSDSTTGVFDDDLAIIQIDLGAVARYPGYYLKSDGFISDEMYIQDGSYYQAFSYVIRVEEEMRKYADIIRALVHPTGMKMFAEYNIFTHIIVSAGVPNIFRLLQFSDVIQNINDTSYNYDAYVYRANQDGTFDYVPPEDEQGQITAGLVFGRQNKAVLFPRKNISDATVEDYTISTGFTSNQEPVVFVTNYKELHDKSVVKAHTEVIGEGYIAFSGADSGHLYYASPAENGDETYDISYRIVGNQPQIQVEVTRNGNTFTPTYTAIDETTVTVNELQSGDIVKIYVIHEFAKNYDETYLKAMNKPVADSILENIVTTQGTDSLNQEYTFIKNYFETHVKSIEKAHKESITERLINLDSVNQTLPRNYDETMPKGVDKPFPMEYITERKVDSVGQDSAGNNYNFTKNYDEIYSKSLDKRGYNTNPDDPNGLGFGRFDLTLFSTDSSPLEPNLIKSDFSVVDPFEDLFIQKIPSSGQGEIRIHEVTQPLIDNVFIAKAIFAYSQQFILDNVTEPYRDFVKNLTETLLSPDSLAHSLIKPFSDTLAQQTDSAECNPNKGLSDSAPQTDELKGHDIGKSPAETINTLMSGRIILNTYDDSSNYSTLTSYFVSDSNYRDSQVIS